MNFMLQTKAYTGCIRASGFLYIFQLLIRCSFLTTTLCELCFTCTQSIKDSHCNHVKLLAENELSASPFLFCATFCHSGDKKLLTPQPRLRTGFFSVMDSQMIPVGCIPEACTSVGAAKYGRPIGLDESLKVDLIVIGSVAVDPSSGARLGKGEVTILLMCIQLKIEIKLILLFLSTSEQQ
jgi:hypothetical protein